MHMIFSLFLQTIKLSAMASAAAIIIWFIKLLFKNKLSTAWHYYIWFIVIIRLLLPYSLSSPISIYNTVNIYKHVPKNLTNLNSTQAINSTTTAYAKFNISNSYIQAGHENILNILSIAWIIVLIVGAVYLLTLYTVFCSKIKLERPFRDVDICDTLKQCKKIMKINRNIQIKESKNVSTPCITGLIFPVILIPKYMTNKLTNEEIKYIIIHELAHFKRKDILINWIVTVLNLIHWFNPILYFAFKRLRQDSEIACDAKVLSYIKDDAHKEYGNAIINLTSLVSAFKIRPWEASIVSKSEIKKRIIMITKFKRRTLIGTLAGVIAACVIGGSVLTNAKNTNIKSIKTANSKPKITTNVSNKGVPSKTDSNKKSSTDLAVTSGNSYAENKTSNTSAVQKTQKKNVNVSSQSRADTKPAASNNQSTVASSNEEDNYTPEDAAITAINHELGANNKVASVSEGPSGDGYANFANGDIAATVFRSFTENGKKYYSVRLYSISMKKNGGSGAIDNLSIAKDGSLYK